MERMRVLIADDHPFYREGVRTMLSTVPEIDVVAEASSGEEVIALAAEHQPDVILMDIKMPVLNGIEATRRILQADPSIGVLVLTMYDDDDSVFAAMRAGARGYLLKDATLDDVLRAMAAVQQGEAIFSPTIAGRLVGYFGRSQAALPPAFPELTEREYEILTLIAQRRNNAEIASTLFLSPKTVRNHVSNIFSKLQVADRAEAMLAARTAGLGHDPR